MLRRRTVTRLARAGLVALLATFSVLPHASAQVTPMSDTVVKAAFLYNFAKFTTWQSHRQASPITLCVMADTRIASALVETAGEKRIDGQGLDIRQIAGDDSVGVCDVVFIPASETRRFASLLRGLAAKPVLTVSDGKDFARMGGIIEFFVEGGRLRFAINTDAASRARLQLSSRLLGLARIVRDGDAP